VLLTAIVVYHVVDSDGETGMCTSVYFDAPNELHIGLEHDDEFGFNLGKDLIIAVIRICSYQNRFDRLQ